MAGRQIEGDKQAPIVDCYPDGVLIETECNVNWHSLRQRMGKSAVLIETECNVNNKIIYVFDELYQVLIETECNVNVDTGELRHSWFISFNRNRV